ncbi:MAG: arsenate reductase (glutaredoxin) [Bdellovibrionota bacterium]
MAAKIRIYHNPKCSTSRKVLDAIRKAGHEPEVVEYLKAPPSPTELKEVLAMMKAEPAAILRRKEGLYKELGLDQKLPPEGKLLALLHENPVLIERPIVVKGKKAIVARPPERVEELLK